MQEKTRRRRQIDAKENPENKAEAIYPEKKAEMKVFLQTRKNRGGAPGHGSNKDKFSLKALAKSTSNR